APAADASAFLADSCASTSQVLSWARRITCRLAAVFIGSRSHNNVHGAGRGALLLARRGDSGRKNRSDRRAGTPRFRRGNTNSVYGANRRPAIWLLCSAPTRRV